MSYPVITPILENCAEIRMGSPYQVCDLKLKGSWVPKLPKYDCQNIFSQSSDRRYLALVAWDINKNNSPGFKIVIIDSKEKTISETDRIRGCCDTIQWDGVGFTYKIFSHLSGKSLSSLKIIG
jgi:hypothetical protein